MRERGFFHEEKIPFGLIELHIFNIITYTLPLLLYLVMIFFIIQKMHDVKSFNLYKSLAYYVAPLVLPYIIYYIYRDGISVELFIGIWIGVVVYFVGIFIIEKIIKLFLPIDSLREAEDSVRKAKELVRKIEKSPCGLTDSAHEALFDSAYAEIALAQKATDSVEEVANSAGEVLDSALPERDYNVFEDLGLDKKHVFSIFMVIMMITINISLFGTFVGSMESIKNKKMNTVTCVIARGGEGGTLLCQDCCLQVKRIYQKHVVYYDSCNKTFGKIGVDKVGLRLMH